jgi:hypothetical protein
VVGEAVSMMVVGAMLTMVAGGVSRVVDEVMSRCW